MPNAWGLYDMHGNVKEMCNDYWDYDYYTSSSEFIDPQGPETYSSGYICRGGSIQDEAYICRSARRNSYGSSTSIYLGFRVALVKN